MSQEPIPTVLAVLVVKDGAPWLRRCLAALARQTHPRLGVVAVDNASSDGSAEILERLLGPRRVLRLRRDVGFPGAVARVMRSPAARDADHLLLLHDDAFLEPTAVATMLRAAAEEGVGIVGGKVLDADRDLLRDVGGTIDRFGYPSSPLEEGEIDHGQYDSPREVMTVSSAAMLVSRDVWTTIGPPDERLRPSHAHLDLCWRARIAGFRVVVEPAAVARHRAAGDRGERPGVQIHRGRYLDERANLTAVLKNYRLVTLLWVLPLFLAQGLAKVALFLVVRRLADARQSLSGWGWALLHLPGTVRRRFRVRAARRLPDREVAKLMVPVSDRLRRWSGLVSALLFPGRRPPPPLDEDEADLRPPLRRRVGSLLVDQPAAVALAAAVVLGLMAFRDVLFASPLEGGAVPNFPESATAMLARFADGAVPGTFGRSGGSPAAGLLGVGGILTLGNPRTLAWLLVATAPLLAGIATFRALLRQTGEPLGAVIAGVCYALSAVVMWAVSEGQLEVLVFAVGLPWLVGRLERPFDVPVHGRVGWVAGTALGLGVVAAFFPPVWAPAAVVVVLALVVGGPAGRRVVGLGLAVASAVVAAILVFPVLREVAGAGGTMPGNGLAPPFDSILRLSPGPAPGSWWPALFLPAAGALGFVAAAGVARWTVRALLAAAVALPLAWLAGAGWLPSTAAEPVAFLALAALSCSVLAGRALGGLVKTGREAFGARQLLLGLLAVVVAAGVVLQLSEAVRAEWSVGSDRVSPAYPLVETAEPDIAFRVLWLGSPEGGPFPAPGGLPQGIVEVGTASVRYGLTGRHGRSALSLGLPAAGPGYGHLDRALLAVLGGRVRHGGALLAPLGVGYVVAGAADLPPEAAARLDDQLDLLPAREAGGLLVYQNARTIPLAAVLPEATARGAAASGEVLAPARVSTIGLRPLSKVGAWTWTGRTSLDGPGLVYLSTEFHRGWRLEADGMSAAPFPAFGWAIGFEAPEGEVAVTVARADTWERAVEVVALALLWAVVLWLALRRRTT